MRYAIQKSTFLVGSTLRQFALAGIVLGTPFGFSASFGLATPAFAQEAGQFVDLNDPEVQKKGQKPFNLSTPACATAPELVAEATTKRICVSTNSGAFWRVYSLEIWSCEDASKAVHKFRKVTGFRTTNESCDKVDYGKAVEEGNAFSETWPNHWPAEKKDDKDGKDNKDGAGTDKGKIDSGKSGDSATEQTRSDAQRQQSENANHHTSREAVEQKASLSLAHATSRTLVEIGRAARSEALDRGRASAASQTSMLSSTNSRFRETDLHASQLAHAPEMRTHELGGTQPGGMKAMRANGLGAGRMGGSGGPRISGFHGMKMGGFGGAGAGALMGLGGMFLN